MAHIALKSFPYVTLYHSISRSNNDIDLSQVYAITRDDDPQRFSENAIHGILALLFFVSVSNFVQFWCKYTSVANVMKEFIKSIGDSTACAR